MEIILENLFDGFWMYNDGDIKVPFRFLIRYGCPSMEEIESYSQEYKKRLDEAVDLGKLPKNLALEVIIAFISCSKQLSYVLHIQLKFQTCVVAF